MILQMVSHTTINIPMKGHVHGQFSDMNETTKHNGTYKILVNDLITNVFCINHGTFTNNLASIGNLFFNCCTVTDKNMIIVNK